MIGVEQTILQITVSKRLKKVIEKYCKLFGLSVSKYCNFILSEHMINLVINEHERIKNKGGFYE